MPKSKAKTLLTFIGGVNKDGIGGNCSVLEHTDETGHTDRIMFDLGCKFTPWESGFVAAYPNVDEYFDRTDPDTGKEIKATKPVSAIFLTHAHEDHIGALVNYVKMGYKLPPIKAGGFTRNFTRLAFNADGVPAPEIEKVNAGDNILIGENMVVEPVNVSHSIVDSLGFHTLTFAHDEPFVAVMNNGDFLTEEEMPVGKAFNEEKYLEVFKRKRAKQTMVCIDSTSTQPHGKDRIGFDKAVDNTFDVVRDNPDRNIIISPVISRSVQNIAVDIEVARRLGTKICLDGKWLQTVRKAMTLSGYTDFDDVIYKGDLAKYMNDKTISKKYIVCTGAFAQGLEEYKKNRAQNPTTSIPMASATRMALDIHPVIRLDKNCLILLRQRIIDEINGKTGPEMLNRMAAQGAKIVMTPGTHPISNFEQVQMQDSGHANARAIKKLMEDVKATVPNVSVVPIHGNPQQCEDTKTAMTEIGVPSHLVGNHQSLAITANKIETKDDPKATRTWYAVKLVLPSPDDDRYVPEDGISEYWEVDENYQPIRKICEVENVRRKQPTEKGYTKLDRQIDAAEYQERHGKMYKRNQKSRFSRQASERIDKRFSKKRTSRRMNKRGDRDDR